jgi:plastocyanin
MENEFRKRIATPILMLLGLLVGIAVIAFSVSRILLAVPEVVATFTALVLAAYVLFIAVMVVRRTAITPRALGGGMAVGLVALLGAGVMSAQAGIRDLHPEEEGEAGPAATAEVAAEIPEGALTWVAVDIDYAEEVTTATAGEQVIAIDNQGNLPHNVVIDGVGRVDADGGAQASTTVTLEPGSYDYVCDVPGHAATMNGTIEVN